jgi:hypothetical protein
LATLCLLDNTFNVHELDNYIIANSRISIQDQIDCINKDMMIASWRKLGKFESLRRRAAAWAPSKRAAKRFNIVDSNGLPAQSLDEARRLLLHHWQPVFAEHAIFDADVTILSEHIQQAPNNIEWEVNKDEFSSLLKHMRDSAPGPDGVPYSALQAAGAIAVDVLYEAYLELLAGSAMPTALNTSHMVFLPKCEVEDDAIQVRRQASATRPLSLGCTSAKLLAADQPAFGQIGRCNSSGTAARLHS